MVVRQQSIARSELFLYQTVRLGWMNPEPPLVVLVLCILGVEFLTVPSLCNGSSKCSFQHPVLGHGAQWKMPMLQKSMTIDSWTPAFCEEPWESSCQVQSSQVQANALADFVSFVVLAFSRSMVTCYHGQLPCPVSRGRAAASQWIVSEDRWKARDNLLLEGASAVSSETRSGKRRLTSW